MSEPLFRADPYLRGCGAAVVAADSRGVLLDRTVFYPRGGGRPGDRGTLEAGGARIAIADTLRSEDGAILHIPAADADLARSVHSP